MKRSGPSPMNGRRCRTRSSGPALQAGIHPRWPPDRLVQPSSGPAEIGPASCAGPPRIAETLQARLHVGKGRLARQPRWPDPAGSWFDPWLHTSSHLRSPDRILSSEGRAGTWSAPKLGPDRAGERRKRMDEEERVLGKEKSGKGKDASRPASGPAWTLDPALPMLADSVADAVLVLDASGEPLLANRRFRQVASEAGAALGIGGWLGVLVPEDRAQAQALWIEAAEARAPREATLGLMQGGGAVCRVIPIEWKGRLPTWLVMLTDTGPEQERISLRLALAAAEKRGSGSEALRHAAEERLALAEARLREAENRRAAERQQAEQERREAEARAAEAEEALREAMSQLAATEERLRGMAAMQVLAASRESEARDRQEEPEAGLQSSRGVRPEAGGQPIIASRMPLPAEGLRHEEPRDHPEEMQSHRAEIQGQLALAPPAVSIQAPEEPVPGPGDARLPRGAAVPDPDDAAEIDRILDRLRSEALRTLFIKWREARREGVAPPAAAWNPGHPAGSFATVGEAAAPMTLRHVEGRSGTTPLGRVLAGSGPSEAAWRRCADTARPVHEFASVNLGRGTAQTHERLLLPFSSDGRRVDHVLSLVATGEASEGAAPGS